MLEYGSDARRNDIMTAATSAAATLDAVMAATTHGIDVTATLTSMANARWTLMQRTAVMRRCLAG